MNIMGVYPFNQVSLKSKKILYTMGFFGVCVVGVMVVAYLHHMSLLTKSLNKKPVELGREYWAKQIDTRGPQEAYQSFKKKYAGDDVDIVHQKAHIFGELLFEKAGLEGVSVCDDAFKFGCYHSFFAAAMRIEGLSAIPELAQKCLNHWQNSSSCSHGIGHGLIWYFGDSNLTQALTECKKAFVEQKHLEGCSAGVFMEYNLRTMLDPSGALHRPLDKEHPYAPCDTIDNSYKSSCFFEISRLWIMEYASYVPAAKLCQDVSDTALRKVCFFGIGQKIVALTGDHDYNSDWAIKNCAAMPNQEAVISCSSGAAWAFAMLPSTHNQYHLLCDRLSPEGKARCESAVQRDI